MSVRLTELPSGLRVVSDANPALKTAAIGVFAGVGSRDEREDEHGLAHLLEHMAFKGTRKRNAFQIAEEIESVGGDLNAETSAEQTSYFAHVLGADVGLALDVLADIFIDSQFDAEELKREKNVILQEIGAVEDTPDDLIFDICSAAAWPGQPLGRPILGTRESVVAFDREAISAYLKRNYCAAATLVVGAGAVDHDELVRLADVKLAALPACEAHIPTQARYAGGESLVKKPLEQTHTVVAFEGRGIAAADHDAAHVFALAAGGGMSSRLFQEVREKRGLAYAINTFHWSFAETGLFGFYAGSASRQANELIAAAIDCLSQAGLDLSETEVRRAKAQMKVSTLAALESPQARIQQLARQTFAYGQPHSLEEMEARIDRVAVSDARAVGARMLQSPPTVAAIGRLSKFAGTAGVARRLGRTSG